MHEFYWHVAGNVSRRVHFNSVWITFLLRLDPGVTEEVLSEMRIRGGPLFLDEL